MIPRQSAKIATTLAKEFKVLAIVGPRQSGKTTLAKAVFKDHPYVTLENPDTLSFVREDPRGFLEEHAKGAVIDEAQRCPELFSYLQEVVDKEKKPGRYILTGSQHFGLVEKISQSLAGRVGFLRLLPFSYQELSNSSAQPKTLNEILFKGGYPPLYDQPVQPLRWLNAYIGTYVERDVRQILNVQDLATFQQFLKLCAGSVGQLLNLSRIGADAGVDQKTIRNWLGVLEASFLVFRLQPHHANFRKRLVKMPKLYFYDTGLACRLLGVETEGQLSGHPMRGALFENWVLTEFMKTRSGRGVEDNLYFWRNHIGQEIDVVADHGQKLLPIEVKSGATLAADWFKEITAWETLAGDKAEAGCLVYGGDKKQTRHGITVYPWNEIEALALKI